jgi:hypothetical protein
MQKTDILFFRTVAVYRMITEHTKDITEERGITEISAVKQPGK